MTPMAPMIPMTSKTRQLPIAIAVLASCWALMMAGCGAKVSDAQQQDVANIVGGLGGNSSSPSLSLTGDAALARPAQPGFIGLINQEINGALWLAKFKVDAGEVDGLTPYASSCTGAGTNTTNGTTCTTSCPSSSSFKASCTNSGSASNTCNGTTYTFSNESIAVTLDLASITASGGSYTGSLGLNLAFAASVSGGNLTGKTLSCSMGLSFDIAKAKAGTSQTPALNCGNFNCTYDGAAIDCTKLQSDFGTGMKCG